MKSKIKILAAAMTLFMVNPVFAQDMASCSAACCGKETTEERQIAMDPSQWATMGIENDVIGNMTSIVRARIQHNQVVNSANDEATAAKSVRQSKKLFHSKQ